MTTDHTYRYLSNSMISIVVKGSKDYLYYIYIYIYIYMIQGYMKPMTVLYAIYEGREFCHTMYFSSNLLEVREKFD
jgi:hypothetical protein